MIKIIFLILGLLLGFLVGVLGTYSTYKAGTLVIDDTDPYSQPLLFVKLKDGPGSLKDKRFVFLEIENGIYMQGRDIINSFNER